MPLEFADVQTAPLKPKATVHKSGKVGFNGDAAEFMDLRGDEIFCVAYDEDEGPDGDLYLFQNEPTLPDNSCIEVAKAGDYFHLNLRNFFERHGIEYERYKIIYDIDEVEGHAEYVLQRRPDAIERP